MGDPPTIAAAQSDDQRAARVEVILERVDALPTLSPIATRLMRIASAEDADLGEIVTLIESDPALTARVLGMCRRADMGLGDRITTVRRAVVMLGLEALQAAVLSVHVYELLSSQGEELDRRRTESGKPIPRFDRAGLWKHAIAVACASELIAAKNPSLGVRSDEAFVAGLLHDIGRLALELVLPAAYAKVVQIAERRLSDSAPVEREVIGLDHHTAGRRMALRWGLPTPIEHVAWMHAQPLASMPETPHRSLVGLVTLAKSLCRRNHLGWAGDFGEPMDPGELARELGVTSLDALLPGLLEGVSTRCAALGLDEKSTPELLLESITLANARLSAMNQTLERRSRQAARQARVLDAIASFQASWEPGAGVSATLSKVAACAQRAFGPGFYATVYQPDSRRPWEIAQYADNGRVARAHTADAPPGRESDGGVLAALADGSQLTVASVGALPWLTDYLSGAVDLRRVRVLALCSAGRAAWVGEGVERAEPRSDAPTALLLHEPDPGATGLLGEHVRALAAVWSSATLAAAGLDGARLMSNRLAESNRALAETQAELTERESLTRLGEMSAGAAHEMNNPLTVIQGRSQLLASRLTEPRDKAAARAIAEASGQLAELIESMHLLACPPRPEPKREDPLKIVSRAVDRARKRVGTSAPIRVVPEGVVTGVLADREQIESALCELVSNAIEAAPGEIVELRVQTDPDDGRFVVRVVDRGPGLSERASRHAFDPFFSEKAAGRQTGLGLARARRLAELHGGEVNLSRHSDGGTVATLWIPLGTPRVETKGFSGRLAA